MEQITVSLTQAVRIMAHRLAISSDRSFLLEGPPGVAKTALVSQLAERVNRVLTVRKLASSSPEMLGGYPVNSGDDTLIFNRPDWIPTKAGEMVFIDEIGQCPIAVQNVVMSAADEHKIGPFKLPDDTIVIMAANRANDRAGSVALTTAFRSRFDCVLSIEPEKNEWLDHATANNFHPMVIAAVKSVFDTVVDFDPKTKGGFLTLRTLEQASVAMYDYAGDADNPDLKVCLYSCLGEQHASTLIGFAQTVQSLPEYQDIIDKPESIDVTIAMAEPIGKIIANNIRYAHVVKAIRYLRRYPAEQAAAMVTMLPESVIDHPDVQDYGKELGIFS